MPQPTDTSTAPWTPVLAEPAPRRLCTDCGVSRSPDAKRCAQACQFIQPDYPALERAVHGLRGTKHVLDIRNYGLAAGLTIAPMPGEPARRPYEVAMALYDKGFYVRYGGDTLQLAPPFISTTAEIDRLVDALGEALNAAA